MENEPNILLSTHNTMKYAHNEMENTPNILISTHTIIKYTLNEIENALTVTYLISTHNIM